MSDEILLDDAFFENYANKVQEERNNRTGSNFSREYEEVGYVACKPGINKILRFVGLPPEAPGLKRKPWDAKTVILSEVKSDDGKRFTLRLPLRTDSSAHNHIIHRLYDRINEVKWVNKEKVFVNKAKFPDLVERSQKMGFTPEDGDIAYKSANGLKGTLFIINNVIDREDDWCKTHKHTKILANYVNVDDQGRTWGKPGIKRNGFLEPLSRLMAKYKSYEEFDIAMKRISGAQKAPWELKNASVYVQKDLMEELKNDDGSLPDKSLVVIGPLSEEEKNYEKYDLDHFYGPTTYQTIKKRISSIFKECDACLGSKFYDELCSLADEEKAHYEEVYKNSEKEVAEQEVKAVENELSHSAEETLEVTTPQHSAPRRGGIVMPLETGLPETKIAHLKGWNHLTDKEKSLIADVELNSDGTFKKVIWVPCSETEELLGCDCGVDSPASFSTCPRCAAKFCETEE